MKQAKISWQQGQPVSDEFGDVYFSTAGGIAETEYVFLQQNHLPELWQDKENFVIAETGFGTGLNFLTTVMHWLNTSKVSSVLHYISVEKYPLCREDLHQALSMWPQFSHLLEPLLSAYPPAVAGYHQRSLFDGRVCLQLLQGDVLAMLGQLQAKVDTWYLDGFAPDKNPHMWSDKVFQQIARLSHSNTRFSTYTAAGFVRRGLQAVGFEVEKVKGFGRKREMLTGRMNKADETPVTFPWFKLPQFKPAAKRVAVIGAGIAGITTAYMLARQGWQVELIDKHSSIASEASGNPLGVIMPRLGLDESAETEFYTQCYFKTLDELQQCLKVNETLSWKQTGVIQLASSSRILKQIKNINYNAELALVMDSDAASQLAGIPVPDDVLFYPQAGYISPVDLCQTLINMQSSNINLHLNCDIKSLKKINNEWLLSTSNDSDGHDQLITQTDAVVLANAAAVNQFQQTAWMDVQSVRGQISYLPASKSAHTLNVPVCYEGYVLPQQDGQHIIGASFTPDDSLTDIRKQDHKKNIDDLSKWFPNEFESAESIISGRAAIRAASKDRLPMVGPVANHTFYQQAYSDLSKGKAAHVYPCAEYQPGLYVNVAHGARGLTTAFLCAELITAQLNNMPLPVTEKLSHALHPSRFVVRRLKKGA